MYTVVGKPLASADPAAAVQAGRGGGQDCARPKTPWAQQAHRGGRPTVCSTSCARIIILSIEASIPQVSGNVDEQTTGSRRRATGASTRASKEVPPPRAPSRFQLSAPAGLMSDPGRRCSRYSQDKTASLMRRPMLPRRSRVHRGRPRTMTTRSLTRLAGAPGWTWPHRRIPATAAFAGTRSVVGLWRGRVAGSRSIASARWSVETADQHN